MENRKSELPPLPDWKNIDYLKIGTPVQKNAWELLNSTKVLTLLAAYNPILIGTIPIGIDIEGSDIDIACEVYDPTQFRKDLVSHFPQIDLIQRGNIVIGRMTIQKVDFEIYGENTPITQQSGYVHMVVEARLLQLGGPIFQQKIRELKNSGLKTEPAFAKALSIAGNPYQELFNLNYLSTEQLKEKFFFL